MKTVATLMRAMLAAALLLLTPVSVVGISDIGRSEITRIWRDTNEGRSYMCSASYVLPYIDDSRSWLLSAGHCTGASMAARNAAATTLASINWRAVLETHGENNTSTVDIALGTVPEVRDGAQKRLWLAEKMPSGGDAYIHGYPHGVEMVMRGLIVPLYTIEDITFLQIVRTPFGPVLGNRASIATSYPGSRLIIVPPKQLGPGSSGSAVLDGSDRVIAVLWGGLENDRYQIQGLPERYKDWDVVLVTPVDVVHELFKNIGVK